MPSGIKSHHPRPTVVTQAPNISSVIFSCGKQSLFINNSGFHGFQLYTIYMMDFIFESFLSLFTSIFNHKHQSPYTVKFLLKSSRHQCDFPWDEHVIKIGKVHLPRERVDSDKSRKQPNTGTSFVQPNSPSEDFYPGSDTAPIHTIWQFKKL